MKKLLIGLFIFSFLLIGSQAHAGWVSDAVLKEIVQLRTHLPAMALPVVSPDSINGNTADGGLSQSDASPTPNTVALITTTTDLTPRISYWSGKVNQHVSINEGMWQTDSDGYSGATLDKLSYCKKWYPNTVSVVEYKNEFINSWHAAGNIGDYPGTKMSYQCVAAVKPTIISTTPIVPTIPTAPIVNDEDTTCISNYPGASFCPNGKIIPATVDSNKCVLSYKCVSNLIVSAPSITVLSPNGGEKYVVGDTVIVKYTTTALPPYSIIVKMIDNYGNGVTNLPITTISDGSSFSFKIPTTTNRGLYKIEVSNNIGTYIADQSDNYFSIVASATEPTITVVSPNGGENYNVGDSVNVKFVTTAPTPYNLAVKLIDSYGNIIRNLPIAMTGTNSLSFKIPSGASIGKNKIELSNDGNIYIADQSDDYFTINNGTVADAGCNGTVYSTTTGKLCPTPTSSFTVLSPNGGEVFKPGDKITVKWSSVNVPASNPYVAILLNNRITLGSTFTNNDGQETVTLPSVDTLTASGLSLGKNFKISVGAVDSNNKNLGLDSSDDFFTISTSDVCSVSNNAGQTTVVPCPTSSFTVLSPNGGEVFKPGDKITVKWSSVNVPASNPYVAILLNNRITLGSTFTNNDGQETVTLPSVDTLTASGLSLGKNFKISVGAVDSNNKNLGLDSSDDFFTIGVDAGCNGTVYSTTTGQLCPSVVTTTSVKVISPKGGDVLIQGVQNIISWTGGKNKVQIGLFRPISNSQTDKWYGVPGVAGWIELNGKPDSNLTWNGLSLKDLDGNSVANAVPGDYKIVALSEGATGNYCISGDKTCNFNLSDKLTLIPTIPVDKGCSAVGTIFSTITGKLCPTVIIKPVDKGCSATGSIGSALLGVIPCSTTVKPADKGCAAVGSMFSVTTGQPCSTITLKEDTGCSTGNVYSTTTGKFCVINSRDLTNISSLPKNSQTNASVE